MANFKSYLYNSLDWYDRGGSFTWTKPADIDTISQFWFMCGELVVAGLIPLLEKEEGAEDWP